MFNFRRITVLCLDIASLSKKWLGLLKISGAMDLFPPCYTYAAMSIII